MDPLSAATLGLGLGQTLYGLYQTNQLNNQPLTTSEVSPEVRNAYNRAESMTSQGFTPQEQAAFKQNLAGQTALGYRNAVNMAGGSLSGAIGRGLNAMNLNAISNFAGQDASLRRKNIAYADALAQHIESINNQKQQQLLNRRLMAEQAAGGTLRSGLTNIINPLNQQQAFNFYKDLYGNKQPKIALSPTVTSDATGIGIVNMNPPIPYEPTYTGQSFLPEIGGATLNPLQ